MSLALRPGGNFLNYSKVKDAVRLLEEVVPIREQRLRRIVHIDWRRSTCWPQLSGEWTSQGCGAAAGGVGRLKDSLSERAGSQSTRR